MKSLKVYVAGKVSKDSQFGTHHWREEFYIKLSDMTGINLENLDPLAGTKGATPQGIFNLCVKQIGQCDVLIAYLSDDISVGGSQEILIAKYLKKPVIGFAPLGGKFNGARREMLGEVINDFKDPFVFSTSDVVCGTIEEVAEALSNLSKIKVKDITLIDEAIRG